MKYSKKIQAGDTFKSRKGNRRKHPHTCVCSDKEGHRHWLGYQAERLGPSLHGGRA